MTNLADAILATLIMQRRDRFSEVSRSDLFSHLGFDRDDLRAARERQKKRS